MEKESPFHAEKGFFLPVVMGIMSVLLLVCGTLIERVHTSHYMDYVEWEKLRARSAAWNGLEMMKQRFNQDPSDSSPLSFHIDQVQVKVQVIEVMPKKVKIQAVAYAKMGVKHTASWIIHRKKE